MATESTIAGNVIDQRLDALDRVLLGLLPRSERLAIVADVEARVRAVHEVNSVVADLPAMPLDIPSVSETVAGERPRIARRRSALAVTAGALGIVSLALLFASPIMYLVVATSTEVIGEATMLLLLSAMIVTVAIAGAAAVIMGITALVRLNRRQRTQLGHGWAIAALCTGPLPMLAGALGTITMVPPMMGQLVSQNAQDSSPSNIAQPVLGRVGEPCPPSEVCSTVGGLQPLPVAAVPASNYAAPVAHYPVQSVDHPPRTVATSERMQTESPASLPTLPSSPAPAPPSTGSVAPTGPTPYRADNDEPGAETTTAEPAVPTKTTTAPEDSSRD